MIRQLRVIALSTSISIVWVNCWAQEAQQAQEVQQVQQEQPTLSARDMFWSAADLVGGVTPNPGNQQLVSLNTPPPMPPRRRAATPQKPASSHQIDPNVVQANGYGAQPHLVRAAGNRLGLRYTILEQGDGGYSEVLPTAVFHNKDRVKLSVMANSTGYLYLVQQGSSGAWSSVFPASDAARESNRVEAGHVYLVPTDGTTFEFTGPAGKEKLFLVLSRERVDDLDRMIFGLGQPAKAAPDKAEPEATAAPAKAEPDATAANSGPIEQAMNTVSDALVQKMQGRDLTPVKEQVNSGGGTPKAGSENAIYVVSASASSGADARLVAGFTLDHQ